MARIFEPKDQFILKWNKFITLCCVLCLALEPFFLYIPLIDRRSNCVGLDYKLKMILCILRFILDFIYMVHICIRLRTAIEMTGMSVSELVKNPRVIAKSYSLYFINDILAILPILQIMLIWITPGPLWLVYKGVLKYATLIQCIPRFIRMYPLLKELKRNSSISTDTARARAASNLFLYMLAGHALGAFWYFSSVERQDRCWRDACKATHCDDKVLYCTRDGTRVNMFLDGFCPLVVQGCLPVSVFNFGIYLKALQSGVVETKDFVQKFFYCFCWGLRNLSSLGQNLETSTFVWENVFAVFIAIIGLLLFCLLIGNVQKYLESMFVRIEKMTAKHRDVEEWMSRRKIPQNLRDRIEKHEQYKWQETRGVDEDRLISTFPKDLGRDIKRHICLDFLKTIPIFERLDAQLLDALCYCLRPVLYMENSLMIEKNDLVEELVIIKKGKVQSTTTGQPVEMEPGYVFGEELVKWVLHPNSSRLPSSTTRVQAINKVEGFALTADDLKWIAFHFHETFHRGFGSDFGMLAASRIQAAWHSFQQRKLERSLQQQAEGH